MTKPPEHTVTNRKHPRGPNLDPLWLPSCATCGPLSPGPTDIDAAKDLKRRHEARVAGLAEGDGVDAGGAL